MDFYKALEDYMVPFNELEKEELRSAAQSSAARNDFVMLSKNRIDPFIQNGKCDVDTVIRFFTEFNEFISHRQKPFHPMTGSHFLL